MHRPFGEHDCDSNTDCVQLYCTGGGPVRSPFLLEHSDEGILSLNYEDTSKAICDDGFT